jgi:hypothetical protein
MTQATAVTTDRQHELERHLLLRAIDMLDIVWKGDDYLSPESVKAFCDEARLRLIDGEADG